MSDEHELLTERLRNGLAHRAAAPDLDTGVVAGAATRTPPRLADPHRRLQAAGAATLAVAAVTVGALVVTSPFQQAPLFTASGAAPTSALAQDSGANELRIAQWIDYRYQAGSGLATAGGSGSVFELRRIGSPEDVLAAAAEALGLDGAPERSEYFDEGFPTYVIGPEDGSGPSVTVSWVGTGNWWFSDPGAYPPLECEPVAPDTGDLAPERDACAVPEAPVEQLAPDADEARSLARELFAATGLDVAADDIRVVADEWQTVATAGLEVDGVATAIEWSVAWAPSGRIAWATGHAIEPVDRGDYGTVSPVDAVARLADGRWFGAPGPDFQGGMTTFAADALRIDVDAPVASDVPGADAGEEAEPAPSPSDDPVVPSDDPAVPTDPAAPTDPTDSPRPAPEPEVTILPEPLPEPTAPEIVEVTVDEAHATLLLVWDARGNAWLVPGYAMSHPDGGWLAVISLVEGVIELPELKQIEPLILEDQPTR